MQSFLDIYNNSKNLHHVYYFVEKDTGDIVNKIKIFLEDVLKINTSNNPDFFYAKYDSFNIQNARELSQIENRRDFLGNKKIFILELNFITEEAQNSLLKVFEEPSKDTHFFIVSPQDILLPTFRSRMQVFNEYNSKTSQSENFLSLSIKDKLNLVKEITEGIKDEEKTKQDAIEFLNKIEFELYSDDVFKNADKLKICEKTRVSLYDRGAPVKMILENLVLNL